MSNPIDATSEVLGINVRTTAAFSSFPWFNGIILSDGLLADRVNEASPKDSIREDHARIIMVRSFPLYANFHLINIRISLANWMEQEQPSSRPRNRKIGFLNIFEARKKI